LGQSTAKKVLISRFDRPSLSGFVNPLTYLLPQGVEILSPSGTVSTVPYEEVKTVAFVRDFQTGEPKQELRLFNSRPKLEGLWIRMKFRDGDLLDGIVANDLLQIEPPGYTVVPPSAGNQNQRLFVPRAALVEIRVMGVVGSPLRTASRKLKTLRDQLEMFEKG
jgi:hypothetical protein